MIDFRPATWSDVESVLARISDANRVEYERIRVPVPLRSTSSGLDPRTIMMAGETQCLWFDDKPHAFISVAQQGGLNTTWLGVTDECLRRGAGPIKAARKYLRATADRVGPITSFLTSMHPRIVKWMALMGFEMIEERPGVKVFRYA
jgi:hypothetical protein